VLVAVIVVKELLFRYVLRESMNVGSTAVQCDAWHHRSDAITSAAAFIGISIALLGGETYVTADEWAAIVAACVIGWNAWRLLRPAVNELMDRSPNQELVDQIREIAGKTDGVNAVEKCFVRKMGFHYFVDMHVEVHPEMTVQRSHDIAHAVKNQVCAAFPSVRDVLVHIEPGR
jgi:cation diffusion facilitator family transporter